MPDYRIRAAQPRDLEGVYVIFSLADQLHRQAHPEIFKEADDPDDIKDYLLTSIQAGEAALFVAENEAGILGAVIAWERQAPEIPMLVPRRYLSVDNLVVAEGFRRLGVGEALMERVHLWAKDRGLKEVQLTVWDFNEGARAFYQRLDYEMLHHRMRKELP